jgi:hypothetical protein
MRGIQYAAAFRLYHRRLWDTGSSAFADDDSWGVARPPAEDDWVTSEQRTRNGAKIQRLLNSKEYGRSMLKTTFSDCNDTATRLNELIQQFPRKKESSELFSRLEAREFIKLAMNFDTFLDPYSSKLDLNKNMKFALAETYIHVIRFGLLKAAREALQDVP